jgi:hypothetical protein
LAATPLSLPGAETVYSDIVVEEVLHVKCYFSLDYKGLWWSRSQQKINQKVDSCTYEFDLDEFDLELSYVENKTLDITIRNIIKWLNWCRKCPVPILE